MCDFGWGINPIQEGIQADFHLQSVCDAYLEAAEKQLVPDFAWITVMRSILIDLSYGQYKLFIAILDMPYTCRDLQNKIITPSCCCRNLYSAESWCPQIVKSKGEKKFKG